MLVVNWGGAVAEEEQEKVDGLGVVDEVAMPGATVSGLHKAACCWMDRC